MKRLAFITVAVITLSACCVKPMHHRHYGPMSAGKGVVLINTFEVPAGQENATRESWIRARDFLQTQPGYISTRLHENIDPNGKYHFVNIAQWRSAADFQAAIAKMRQMKNINMPEGTQATPGLFKVVSE